MLGAFRPLIATAGCDESMTNEELSMWPEYLPSTYMRPVTWQISRTYHLSLVNYIIMYEWSASWCVYLPNCFSNCSLRDKYAVICYVSESLKKNSIHLGICGSRSKNAQRRLGFRFSQKSLNWTDNISSSIDTFRFSSTKNCINIEPMIFWRS